MKSDQEILDEHNRGISPSNMTDTLKLEKLLTLLTNEKMITVHRCANKDCGKLVIEGQDGRWVVTWIFKGQKAQFFLCDECCKIDKMEHISISMEKIEESVPLISEISVVAIPPNRECYVIENE